MSSKVPMTHLGSKKLTEELNHLKHTVRHQVIEAIAEARALGDLKENAEYHAAREQQGFVEGRIQEIEEKLSNAQIIDVSGLQNQGKVIFGATVSLIRDEAESPTTYQIVGEDEADLKEMKISFSSPMARALIGKFRGDEVEVNTPSGNVNYYIQEVQYI